jgi:flagellar hook-basal body complex protein FliE
MADISYASAAAAYNRSVAAAAAGRVTAPAPVERAAAGTNFAEFVSDALDAARETGIKSETQQARAINGEIGMQEVVTAVTNAELTLQTVVSLRDKAIAAYNDILRMPI